MYDNSLQFLSNTGDGALAMDAHQRIIYWNEAAEKILGYRAEEVIGRQCYELFGGKTRQCAPWCCFHCDVVRLMQQQSVINTFQIMVRHRNGKQLLLDVSTIIHDNDSQTGEGATIIHLFRLLHEAPTQINHLRIQLLGTIRVWQMDRTRIQGPLWQQAKVRALFALLALNNGRPISKDIIIERLWPDMENSSAQHNLHTAVYNLRRSLEPNLHRVADSRYIFYKNGSYSLNSDTIEWLDIQAFEKAVRHASQNKDAEQAITFYQEAVELYRNDLLINLNNLISWHLHEQDRLRDLFLKTLEEMGSLYEQQGDEKTARMVYLQVLAKDPCHESACRRLMRLCWRQHNRAAAIAHFQRLTATLEVELGILPGKETQALYQRIQDDL